MGIILKIVAVPIVVIVILTIIAAQVNVTGEIESKKIKAIRKLFTSTSLSAALLSFISTMEGLQLYIFQDKFISAFVLSGAVQGALFGISTEFFKIMNKFSKKISKSIFITIWIGLLLFSSGFSYVGIRKTAYSDDALKEDAEQILIQYCLDTDYELLDYTKKLENFYLENFYSYLDTLNGGAEGFAVSAQDRLILDNEKADLEAYQNIKEVDNSAGTKTDASAISDIFDTEMLCTYIDIIKEGNYSNELEAYKSSLRTKIEKATEGKEKYDQWYDDENKLIAGDPDADTEAARLGYNGRSAQYRNLSDPNFTKLQQDITASETKKTDFDALRNELKKFINLLEECQQFIEKDFETSTENEIYLNTLSLRKEINKEIINTDAVISTSEEIYNKLVENNTAADNDKITGYAVFKKNVSEYKSVIIQKQNLEKEIEDLNDYGSELLLGSTKQETDTLQDSTVGSVELEEGNSSSNEEDDLDSEETWKSTWSNHLLTIQSVVKELPADKTKLEDTLNTDENVLDKGNIISMPKEKSKYLEEISDRRRLYLTDINDFERAWKLLFSSFHPLKYKLMLFVSVIIAFGLDLISFSMGCLLFEIKNKEDS